MHRKGNRRFSRLFLVLCSTSNLGWGLGNGVRNQKPNGPKGASHFWFLTPFPANRRILVISWNKALAPDFVQRQRLSVTSWPDTESSLLGRLGDRSDDEAWIRFDQLYRPVIYRHAIARGLQHSDAELVVSDVMSRVFRAASRWSGGEDDSDSSKPRRFRSWLHRVAENSLLNLVTRELARRGTGGTSHQMALSGRPRADSDDRMIWEQQQTQQLFQLAAGHVQASVEAKQWEIFWQTHIDGIPIAEVARQSGRSVGAIYALRSRVLRQLRAVVQQLRELDDPQVGGRR